MQGDRLVGLAKGLLLVVGVAMAGGGCIATQSYVDDQDTKVRSDLHARLDALEPDARATRDQLGALAGRVNGLETQLAQVRDQVNDARQRADRAQARADEGAAAAQRAQQKADEVDGKLARSLANRYKREQVQEVHLLFATGKSDLTTDQQQQLDGVVKALMDNPTYTANVMGYADTVGRARPNLVLSWYREESVRRYLVEKGVDLRRLSSVGFGEEVAKGKTAQERAQDRHVTVRLLRPAN